MSKTSISWCDFTFNPWHGCSHVGGSPACYDSATGARCYAETWDKRLGGDHWGDDKTRRYFGDKHWAEPIKWNRAAEKDGVRARVFCMSMGDWAEGRLEQKPHLERLWKVIQDTPCLDWLMLTKRPQLISKLCPVRDSRMWQGTTAETQYWFDLRWEHLKRVESEIYWFSLEPLYERIVLPADFLALEKRAWIIAGGQSGHGARPMHPDWVRSLRDQCGEAGIAFHFKQFGEFAPALVQLETLSNAYLISADPRDRVGKRIMDTDVTMVRIGKKNAGRTLDGRTWDEFPEVQHA